MTKRDLVILTGGSRGLGLAVADVLLDSGFRVLSLSRKAPAASAVASRSGYMHHEFDVANTEAIPSVVREIHTSYGPAFGLVNNAGRGDDGLLPTMHNSAIRAVIETNLLAPIVLSKYVSRQMLAARRGRIVNISSVVAGTGYRGLSAYAATKGGLEAFTRSLARDLGPRGVTVNCVAPGFMDTDMTATLSDANLDRIRRRSALGRFPTTTEVAKAVGFLFSEPAAGITGTTITVDAGNSA